MKRTKRIRHSSGEKVSSNLTLERSGLHSINAISSFLRGFVIAPDTYNGAVTEGLVATKGTGSWDVDISFPASCIQVRGDDLIYATDPGDGTGSTTLTLSAADPVNSRYDIIEARVNTRESFNDDVVYRVDPATKVVATKSVTRDVEYYIELRATEGTPAGSPTPPATSATGTVAEVITPVLGATVDLTSRYLLNLAVGDYDSEYITVDLRAGAADFSIVSLTHVVSNINTAWGSTICNVTGSNEIRFATTGTGGDKVVRFKELGSIRAIDAIEVLFVGTTLGPTNRESIILGAAEFGYEFEQTGSDGWFKIAEILVVGGSSALVPTDVVPRAQQASWVLDANTIQNLQRFLDLQNGDTVIFTGLMGHTKTLWRDVTVPSLSTVVTFGDFTVDDSVSLIVPDDSDYIHWDDSWKGYVDEQNAVLQSQITANAANISTNTSDIISLAMYYDDTDTTSDLAVTGLPDNGPWFVTVHGAVYRSYLGDTSASEIRIRENTISGTLKGTLKYQYFTATGSAADYLNATGSAIINSNSFYIEMYVSAPGVAPSRRLVTWRKI